jgi:hypothetical protein
MFSSPRPFIGRRHAAPLFFFVCNMAPVVLTTSAQSSDLHSDMKGARFWGDAHGHAPLFRPVVTFLPSRHRNKVDRFVNRRGIIGLVGFAVPPLPLRAPLVRFRVGLMVEIPARENFKITKTSKNSQFSLGPREKLLGRAGLVL